MFGLLQYATLSQGHTNSVHFCLFVVYWFHVHLRRRGLIEQKASLNVPGEDSFNPLNPAIEYHDTTIEQHMDDIFGSGPNNLYEANYQCKRVVTEANRLGLVQHPDKLKPPIRTNKQSESQDEVRHYGGFVITTSPLSSRGADATLASARVMAEVILDVQELA